MSTLLLTGVTGMIGSVIAPILKKYSHRIIYLIRSSEDKDSFTRFHELYGNIDNNDIIVESDITLPHAGISNNLRRLYTGRIDKIIHCAASIKFDDKFAEEINKINIDGTRTIIELANELKVPEIHYVSTAYIAGDANSFSENDFDLNQLHRNVYESSKMEAERLIRSLTNKRYSIYRLGIVIGNSINGYTPTYHGYYGFLKTLWRLRRELLIKWKNNQSECINQGFYFDSKMNLCVPLKINYDKNSTINMVTIDWISILMTKLINLPANNITYHLTHPNPPKIDWLMRISLPIIKFNYNCINQNCVNPFIIDLQRMIDNSINRFQPYLNHEAKFIALNVERVLKDIYEPPPEIDETLINKLINYALQNNFGIKG